MAQIARLTDRQVAEIYGRAPKARDEESGDEGQSYKDVFWAVWRKRGWSDEDIQTRWEREQGDDQAG